MRLKWVAVSLCLVLAGCQARYEAAPVSNVREDTASEAGEEAENASAEFPGDIENAANATDGEPVTNASKASAGSSGGQPAYRALVWCPAIKARTSRGRCDDLTEQQASLEAGVAAFNPPRKMMVGKASRVILPIGAQAERAAVVAAAGGVPGTATTVSVRIGRYMSAKLSGSAFDIKPVGEPLRDLGGSSSETWEWDVTPTDKGTQTLRVEVETFAEDETGGRTRLTLYRSPPIDIDVEVTAQEKRKETYRKVGDEITNTTPILESLTKWLGLFAGLVLAAGVVWWRLRNFGRKPKDDDQKPE